MHTTLRPLPAIRSVSAMMQRCSARDPRCGTFDPLGAYAPGPFIASRPPTPTTDPSEPRTHDRQARRQQQEGARTAAGCPLVPAEQSRAEAVRIRATAPRARRPLGKMGQDQSLQQLPPHRHQYPQGPFGAYPGGAPSPNRRPTNAPHGMAPSPHRYASRRSDNGDSRKIIDDGINPIHPPPSRPNPPKAAAERPANKIRSPARSTSPGRSDSPARSARRCASRRACGRGSTSRCCWRDSRSWSAARTARSQGT